MQRILEYFTNGITSRTLATIGTEIETQFVDKDGRAIKTQISQEMLAWLVKNGWMIDSNRNGLITALVDEGGNRILYELGRHNIEISTVASTVSKVANLAKTCLDQLYESAARVGAQRLFSPILDCDQDLLIIPDDRDATWIKLDGRNALIPLARTSSVQFTISVSPKDSIRIINKLGEKIDTFLEDYPQDLIWKQYITNSLAKYLFDRYGGPLKFDSLEDYCSKLTKHDVIQEARLVPLKNIGKLNIPLYLRSIWWHFRFKRYDNSLCIEIRPIARREDSQIQNQIERILEIFC